MFPELCFGLTLFVCFMVDCLVFGGGFTCGFDLDSVIDFMILLSCLLFGVICIRLFCFVGLLADWFGLFCV